LSENNRFEKKQISRSKLKSGNFSKKKFLFENLEVAKSFSSKEKKWKSANLSNSTEALNQMDIIPEPECKKNELKPKDREL
jgi:hypothetical protein